MQSPFDLKLCPWCGGPADIEEIGGKDGAPASFSVGCHDGDGDGVCFGYQSLTSFARKSDAVRAWNTRSPCVSASVTKADLLSIARRWIALDAGAWHPERHAAEKAQLTADTRAAIAKATTR